MAYLAQPTSTLNSSAEPADTFVKALQELHTQHEEDRRLLAAARQEIEQLRAEVAALRAGQGIILNIAGRHFALRADEHPLAEAKDNDKKSDLADSFIL